MGIKVAPKYTSLWHNNMGQAPPKSVVFCPTCWWSYDEAIKEASANFLAKQEEEEEDQNPSPPQQQQQQQPEEILTPESFIPEPLAVQEQSATLEPTLEPPPVVVGG